MQLASYQMYLFPWRPLVDSTRMSDHRTPLQILQSTRAYCLWRAGESWRKMHVRSERFADERMDYLHAASLIHAAIYTPEKRGPEVALPPLHPPAPPVPQAIASLSHGELVDEYLRRHPELTMRKSVARFKTAKLRRLLADDQPVAGERAA